MDKKRLIFAPAVVLLAAASFATAQTNPSVSTPAPRNPVSITANEAKAYSELEAAAQRLRDSIHTLVEAPPGPKRNDAIKAGNKTLLEISNALANLPADSLATVANEDAYKKSLREVEQTAQRLRDSTHALVTLPPGKERNDEIKRINKALGETQQMMIDIQVAGMNK